MMMRVCVRVRVCVRGRACARVNDDACKVLNMGYVYTIRYRTYAKI